MPETLYLPTEEACKAYGIPRAGIKSGNDLSTTPFLSGPQFRNIKAASKISGGNDVTVDEVILNFIKNKPYTMEFTDKTNSAGATFKQASFKPKGGADDPLLTIRIAPNTTDWANLVVKHSWEKPGGLITSLFESVTSLLSAGNGILAKILNVTTEEGATEQTIQVDQADAYKSTDNIEFTVPFLLWSAGSDVEDWIRDIYFPIMLLTAWSHPKRASSTNIDKGLKAALNAGASATGTTSPVSNEQNPVKELVDGFNKIYPGARISVLDPPSYITVQHSSGLFYFNRCVITSFSFKYMDPWVRATSINSLNDANKQFLSKSLPMRAECALTLRSVEKVYADDWISMFEKGKETLKANGGKVSVDIIGGGNSKTAGATFDKPTTSPPQK